LGLFLGVVTLLVLGLVGATCWEWPRWIPFILNTLGLFTLGVVLHDSAHGSAHRTPWVNSCLGHSAAILQGFVFSVFVRVHQEHHAHVNHPTKDPDHFVSTGGPLWLIPVRFEWHEIFFFKHRLWHGWPDLAGWVIDRTIQVMLLALCWYLGPYYFYYCLNLWVTPAGVAGLMMGLIFDYFPHRPFKDQRRWFNTRVYPNRWLNWLIFGQNYHLAHHLWPTVPWYNYEKAYWSRQELFIEQGALHGINLTPQQFIYDCLIGIHLPKKP
jgi:beta-carotene hydroxylase